MLTIESTVVAVTVYRAGALVTREATVDRTPDGFPRSVQLVGLPLTLQDASIRVEVDAPTGSPPLAGDVRVTVSLPHHDDRLPPSLDEALQQARLDHAIASRALADAQAALQRLGRLEVNGRGTPARGEAPAPSPTAARMQLLALRRQRQAALHERVAQADASLHDAKERLDTLLERQRVGSDARNARRHELRKAAIIGLSGDAPDLAPTIRLRVRYFVSGARWAPAYTVRLDAEMASGSLQVRAVVGQRTGEDWRNVALTLSTAHPQHWTELPEVKAIRIGRAQPPPHKTGWRPPPTGADALFADYDRALPRRVVPEPVRRQAPPSMPPPTAEAAPMRSGPAAPPMPPMGAPAPAAARALDAPAEAQSVMRSRGLGLGGLVDGVVGSATAMFGAAGGGSRAEDSVPASRDEADAGIVAGRDLLDYSGLQLYPADHPERGRLRRVEPRQLYERWAVEKVGTDLMVQRLSAAQGEARALEHSEPPPGHRWVDDDSGFDYAYTTDANVDVASDGKLTALAVATHDADVTPRYVSVPRETQDVFRIVAIRNPIDAPLLPGPADVYVAGKFALTSDLETTPPRGRLEIGLGVEQAIKIARNVVFEEDAGGLLKRSHDLVHTIRIDVTNNMPRPAVLEVRERIGVKTAGDDDIEVQERAVAPPWEEYEPRQPVRLEGGRMWKIQLAAGGEQRLTATWVVRVPHGHELQGGNRRET